MMNRGPALLRIDVQYHGPEEIHRPALVSPRGEFAAVRASEETMAARAAAGPSGA